MSTSETRLLTPRQVAAELGVSRSTVYRRLASGEWPSLRLGSGPQAPVRVDPEALAARIAEGSALDVPNAHYLPLDVVAERIGKPVEWLVARLRLLPHVETALGPMVLNGDLRRWHEAAQEPPQTREGAA